MKSFSNEYEPTADGSILLMSGVQHALHAAQVLTLRLDPVFGTDILCQPSGSSQLAHEVSMVGGISHRMTLV